MVLGLALFATMAFAQTNVSSLEMEKGINKKSTLQIVKNPGVDYKASIFGTASDSKAMGTNVGDTIPNGFWNFDDLTGVVYGSDGVIGSGEYVRMMNADSNYAWVRYNMQPHSLSSNSNLFMFIPDTNYIKAHSADYTSTQGWSINVLIRSILDRVHTNYMMIYPLATVVNQTKRHNAYFKLPAIENPSTTNKYEVRILQNYMKFYDRCYIDFKVGNEWYAREINVNGVDVNVNKWNDGKKAFTMPVEFGQQANLEIRFRLYNPPTSGTTGIQSDAYGYIWAIDDIAIVRSATYAWSNPQENYVDGGYGTLPYGMNVPLAWFGYALNDGAMSIDSPVATVYHIDANGTPTEVTSKVGDTLRPITGAINLLTINERGFYDSIWSPGWFGYASTYQQPASAIPAEYGRHGLPNTTPGVNMVTVTADAGVQYEPLTYDTIGYRVVGQTGGVNGLSIEGYRWAHDNGVIAKGPAFTVGRTVSDGEYYVTETGSYDQAGYTVTVRFTTPDDYMTDMYGDTLVIKGIEIIPATNVGDSSLNGSVITPILSTVMYFDSSDGNNYTWLETMSSELTGISSYDEYTVQSTDANTLNNSQYGYIAPGDNNYRAINIRIPGQPKLEPNTALHIGYRMAQDGNFAAARQLNYYVGGPNAAGTGDSAYRFADNPDLAAFAHPFTPWTYDVRVLDPLMPRQNFFCGSNYSYWPMIRLIVGSYEEIPTKEVFATCPDTNVAYILNSDFDDICGASATGYVDGDVTVFVAGAGDSTTLHPGIIDTLFVDDDVIDVNRDFDEFGEYYGDDYTILEVEEKLRSTTGQVLLTRYYYRITFGGLQNDHNVSFAGHTYPYDLGIEGEAISVSLGMRPNPASQNVTLNMTGVTGMVNCSIIDMSGRVIYNRAINAENSHTIDLSNVAAGAYFVRVTNDSFSKVEKLIVR